MDMRKHTKEPWSLEERYRLNDQCRGDPNGYFVPINGSGWGGLANVVVRLSHTDKDSETGWANARRIVDCVNALAGMNPAAVREVVEALEHIKALCPDETGSMSTGALAGLLFNIETTVDAALAKLREVQE
jgi:hypothetical protein